MSARERIAEFHDELTNWRRDIHAHPELGFEEQRTSDLVAKKLAQFGYEVFRGIGRTGGGRGRLRGDSSRAGVNVDDAFPAAFVHRAYLRGVCSYATNSRRAGVH